MKHDINLPALQRLRDEAMDATFALSYEYEVDTTAVLESVRDAYRHHDYTALADWRDSLQLRLAERRAGV